MLLGHRYYDASIGRLISEDPIQAGDNWYAYCENNPLNSFDADGQQAEHTAGARASTKGVHEEGQARQKRDQGGEKGDKRRKKIKYPSQDERGPFGDRRRVDNNDSGGMRDGIGDRRKRDLGRGARNNFDDPSYGFIDPDTPPSLRRGHPDFSGIDWGKVGIGAAIIIGIVGVGLGTATGQPEVAVPAGMLLKRVLSYN